MQRIRRTGAARTTSPRTGRQQGALTIALKVIPGEYDPGGVRSLGPFLWASLCVTASTPFRICALRWRMHMPPSLASRARADPIAAKVHSHLHLHRPFFRRQAATAARQHPVSRRRQAARQHRVALSRRRQFPFRLVLIALMLPKRHLAVCHTLQYLTGTEVLAQQNFAGNASARSSRQTAARSAQSRWKLSVAPLRSWRKNG